jgi:predicted nucleic acid-binding protein
MAAILVDSNVLIDVATGDPRWGEASRATLKRLGRANELIINPIIFAEVSISFERIEEIDGLLPPGIFRREAVPWEAAFLAGKAFVAYRHGGGERSSPLPDFFIGAHAAIRGYDLLTRDPRGFRGYFPTLKIVSPETHP